MALRLGTRSEGTLKPNDIASAIREDAAMWIEDPNLIRLLDGVANETSENPNQQEIVDDTITTLNEYVPPFCYYGSLEGDAACIGVFVHEDAIEFALAEGDLTPISDPSQMNGCAPGHYLFVNDHGNATLFEKDEEGNETSLWAVV